MLVKKKTLLAGVVSLSCFLGSVAAQAVPFGFDNITGNNATDAQIGEDQLTVDVTDAGAGNVLFTFSNSGPEASSITQIYFDDDVPLFSDLVGIDNSDPGVNYVEDTTPGGLPGGNCCGFHNLDNLAFEVDPTAPVQPNGVNPGESVGITLSLLGGWMFTDVIAAMQGSPTFRIGIHVQGFANTPEGGSESFINNPDPLKVDPPAVPLPAAFWLLLSGLGLLKLFGTARDKLWA